MTTTQKQYEYAGGSILYLLCRYTELMTSIEGVANDICVTMKKMEADSAEGELAEEVFFKSYQDIKEVLTSLQTTYPNALVLGYMDELAAKFILASMNKQSEI